MPNESSTFIKVISGPNTGAEISLQKDKSYTLGKNPEFCDVVFQDLSVSKKHASLTVNKDNKFFIKDLKSKNGVKINDKLITEESEVVMEDVVSMGTTSFLIVDQSIQSDTVLDTPEEKKKKEREKRRELER